MANENQRQGESEGRLTRIIVQEGKNFKQIKLPVKVCGVYTPAESGQKYKGDYRNLVFIYKCEEDEGIGGGTSRWIEVYGTMQIRTPKKLMGSETGILYLGPRHSLQSSYDNLRNSVAENSRIVMSVEFIEHLFEVPSTKVIDYITQIKKALRIKTTK